MSRWWWDITEIQIVMADITQFGNQLEEVQCIIFYHVYNLNSLNTLTSWLITGCIFWLSAFMQWPTFIKRAGLRSVFCLYGTCFHFFGDTLFIRQMHAGNNAADKCGRQIQQIQVINPTNLAARGNLAPIGAGSWQWHGAISASFTSSQSPSDWQLDNPLRLTTGQVQPVCWS